MPPRIQNPNLMGLSDFGLTAPSASSNVDTPASADVLGELLGKNEVFDAQSQVNLLDQYMAGVQGQENPGTLDRLKSPQGLLALLMAGAAGAVGGPAAAAGVGAGALTGANAARQAQATAQREALEVAQKQRDDALGRLDKSHQRFTSLLQSQPELFMDAEGNQTVSPEVLGYYATGTPTKLFATTKRALALKDASWASINKALSENLEKSTSVEDARKIVDAWFINMGYQAPPEVAEAMARNAGTPQWTTEAMNTLFRYGGATALDASITARENGWGPFDPRTLGMISFRDPDVGTNKVTPNDVALKLSTEINAWQQDPANRETLRKIAAESKTAEEKSLKVAQAVLGGREGDLRTYLHEMNLHDPENWRMNQANFNMLQGKYKLHIGLSGMEDQNFQKLSSEEQAQYLWSEAQRITDEQNQQKSDEQAKQFTVDSNETATRLTKELGVSPDIAGAESARIAKLALDASTSPNGDVDWVRFKQEIKKHTDAAIAEANKQ